MDAFLTRVANQSMTFAIRSGIGVVSSFAMSRGAQYIKTLKGKDKQELIELHRKLEAKIRIITPAIDLVELVAARGNTALENAITLTKSLRADLQSLGVRFANALSGNPKHKFRSEPKSLERELRDMLLRLEDAVPLITLALNASGVDLSTAMPDSVSPSRMLQASTFITAGDAAYYGSSCKKAQVGPNFTLKLYMLFGSHTHRRQKNIEAHDLTWQEVLCKCRVKLERVPLHQYMTGEDDEENTYRDNNKAKEFCYDLVIIEDLDDGRVHDEEELAKNGMGGPYEGVGRAGIRSRIPIHQIGKIFYTSSGKLLGIEESTSPILLVNRQVDAVPPRKLEDIIHEGEYDFSDDEEHEQDGNASSISVRKDKPPKEHHEQDLPKHLDQEWLAFEIYQEDQPNYESDAEDEANEPSFPGSSPPDMSSLAIDGGEEPLTFNDITVKSHLSLLEMLIRLLSLQTTIQSSHLTAHDELLNLFLTNASAPLNPAHSSRKDEREAARKKLGFDPFIGQTPRHPRTVQLQESPAMSSPAMSSSGRSLTYDEEEGYEDVGLPRLEGTPAGMRGMGLGYGVRDSGISSLPGTPVPERRSGLGRRPLAESSPLNRKPEGR